MAFNQSMDISGWVTDSTGIHAAGWGLTLTPMDMAKIGQLYLNGGTWEGKRIISSKWVEDSTTEHSRWKKKNLAYGYLWWVNEDGYAALFIPRAGDSTELIKKFIEPAF